MSDPQPTSGTRYYRNPQGGLSTYDGLDDDQVLIEHGYEELTAEAYQDALAALSDPADTPEG
ncbi:hypothetical protein [Streptomyces sp. NPDC001068]|uniref:hypothetical protein n=1 Tax=Streptomyces sp. NPDC001068 TaxID=3364544 RepID=UPI0036C61F46